MPIYEFQSPDGRVIEVEGDTIPSEEDLDKIAAALPKPEKPSPLGTAALGAFAGATRAAESAGMAALGAREMLPPSTLLDLAQYGTGIVDEIKRRATRSKVQLVKDVTQAVEPATFAKKYWDETVPRTQAEKESLWGQIPEEAAGMSGYVLAGAAGPLGPPALIAAESAVKHIVGDFENLKQNFGEEEAANIAIQRGLTSGVLQASVFKFLPKPLQRRAEILLRGRLPQGPLGRYVENAAVHAASTGALMGAATIPENLVSGEAPMANVPASIVGGAVLGTAMGAMQLPGKIPTAEQLRYLRDKSQPLRPPATPELRAQRYSEIERQSRESGYPFRWVEGRFPGREQEVTRMMDEGVIEHSRPAWNEYMEQYRDVKTDDQTAIARAISHESLHGGQLQFPDWKEQAVGFWDNFTALEKKAFTRIILGAKPTDPAELKTYQENASNPEYLGREASRYWSQRMSDIGPSEMSELKQRGEFTVRTMDALLAFMRWLRTSWGNRANKHQLDYIKQIEQNANEAKKGAQDASKKRKTTAVYGDVRTQPVEGLRQVPVEEGGPGVQPQAEGRLEEPEEILLDQQRAYKAGLDILAISRKEPLISQHLPATNKPLKGEKITGAVVISKEDGTLAQAPHHPAAEAKAGEPVTDTRAERNNEWYGFATNKRPFVPRELAGRIAQQSGQALTFRDRAFPHSDEIIHPDDPTKTLSGDPITEAHRAPRKVAFKPAPAKNEAELAKLGFTPEDIAGMSNEEAAAVVEVQARKPGFKGEVPAAAPAQAPAPKKVPVRAEPPINPKNPFAERLTYARGQVALLRNEVRRNPEAQARLDDAQVNLAETQRQYNLAEKAPPGVTQGAQAQAPSPVGTITGGAAPGEPVIRQPTLGREVRQPREPGPAQRAFEEHDSMIRRKIAMGGIQTRPERLRNQELLDAALKENPSLLEEEGIGMSMVGRKRTLTPAVREDDNPNVWMAGKNHADARLRMVGEINKYSLKPQNEVWVDENGVILTRSEAIKRFKEITGIENPKLRNAEGLTSEDFAANGLKAEDFYDVEQRYDVKPEEGIGMSMVSGREEVEPPPGDWMVTIQRPDGSTYRAAYGGKRFMGFPGDPHSIAKLKEGKWSHTVTAPGERIVEGEQGPTAGIGMSMVRGRAIPPYTLDEARKIAEEMLPDWPKNDLIPVAKRITEIEPARQDEAINDMRQQILVAKLMKEQSKFMEIQERLEAGTEKRVQLPPEVEANIAMGLFSYFKDAVSPAKIRKGSKEAILQGATETGRMVEGKPLYKLEPVAAPKPGKQPKAALKVRYNLPDPTEWLAEQMRGPSLTGGKPNPYIHQASDRMLYSLYDKYWELYLRHAPAEEMIALRQAHRLDRKDLRGFIPEPELDPILRIFYNFGSGEMEVDKMMKLAEQMDIKPEGKVWQKQVMENLYARILPKLRNIALAENIDVSETGWERKILTRLFGREEELVVNKLKYLEQGATEAQAVQLAQDFQDALQASYRRRSRLERMLLQRGSSSMFIARKSPHRSRISLNDVQWVKPQAKKSDLGPYAQFAKITRGVAEFAKISRAERRTVEKLGLDLTDENIQWLDISRDLKTLNEWLVKDEGGRGAGATKRVTVLYDTKTKNIEAVSTYKNLRTGKAMLYDPRGEPGRRDRDHLRIAQLPDRYRIFGSLLLEDPVGYFHQRWSTDAERSGLAKFWEEVGEVADAAADGHLAEQRVRKAQVERQEKERSEELSQRYALNDREQKAQEELDRLDEMEEDQQREEVRQILAEEGKTLKEREEEGSFTISELSDYSKRFERLAEMQGEEEPEELGGRVSKMPSLELRNWQSREAKGLLRSQEQELRAREVTGTEARQLARLFLRFKIRTDSKAAFNKDMEEMLKWFYWNAPKHTSSQDISVLSAFKKMVVNNFIRLTRGSGLIDELRASAKKAGQTIAEHRDEFYERKKQQAYEYALKDIYEIHAATRGEIAAEKRRTAGPRTRYIAENYQLYPDRFAQRILESFGDNSSRHLDALSVSPKRAAARAIRELVAADRVDEFQVPSPPFSKRNVKLVNDWLRTPSAQSWLRSPEGNRFMLDVAETVMAHKELSNRLLGAKGLNRELTARVRKGQAPYLPGREIPRGEKPPPAAPQIPEVIGGGKLEGPEIAFVSASARKDIRAKTPAVVNRQLAALVDLRETATRLADLGNRLAVESWTPRPKDKIRPRTITVREWLQSDEGKQYLLQRWGMRKSQKETIEQMHERLMNRIESSLLVESRMREGTWEEVSPAATVGGLEPGTGSKLQVPLELEAKLKQMYGAGGGIGLTMRSGTTGRRLREQRNKEVGLPPPEPPEGSVTIPELLSLGPAQYAQGGPSGSPELVRERYKRKGWVSTPERALLIWWDRQLQREVNKLYEDPNYGPNHPETKAAEADWKEWSDWEAAGPGRSASEAMLMRQGVQDIDTGSWVAMKREYQEGKASRGQEPDAFEERELYDEVQQQKSDDAAVNETEEKIRTARPKSSETDLYIGPEQKKDAESTVDGIMDFLDKFGESWSKKERGGAPMAMKGGKAEPLTPREREDLIAHSVREMFDLSRKDSFSENAWRSVMLKKYPSSAPYLNEVWEPALEYRNRLVNQVLGHAKATELTRKYITRTRPTIEQSKVILQRAFKEFPRTTQISPMEATHAWNFVEQKYFQQISDIPGTENFDTVLKLAAADLQIPRERLYQALRANKTMRVLTDELSQRMDKANRVRAHIKSWLQNKREPKMALIAKTVPSVFFMDKIAGHGFVGMITHASNLLFQPWAWRDYFNGWANMYRSVHSKAYHIEMIRSIERDEMFRFAKRMGAEVDPHRFTGDYEVGGWYRWLREKTYGRGFDALKKLRLDLFKTWWQSLPPDLRTEQMGKLIANDVNHMTGIVHSKFPTWSNYTFFAPKLAAAQWGVLVTDPIKAATYMLNGRKSSPEQLRWAKTELWHKAQMVGLYAMGLAVNAGILKVTNSKQEINWDDPKRSDFWSFKIAGFNVGVAGPMIQIVRMFSDLVHIAVGAQSQLEKTRNRPERFLSRLTEYARRKASPFAGFGLDVVTGQDFMGRPLPWSSDVVPRSKRLKGVSAYEPLEWTLQTISPIPLEEAIKELWANMGINKSTASKIWNALAVAAPMSLTGARIWEDPQAAALEESEEPAKGPLTFY